VLKVVGKPKAVSIDGGREREYLDGKRFFDLFVSKSKAFSQGGISKL